MAEQVVVSGLIAVPQSELALILESGYLYMEMQRYEQMEAHENPNSNDYGRIHTDTQLKKFRAERNFYLHFFALILVVYELIEWNWTGCVRLSC